MIHYVHQSFSQSPIGNRKPNRQLAIGNRQSVLSELISAVSEIADETLKRFSGLTEEQLNWQPGADQWSVAQCFDHLVTSNEAYFPIFEKVISGEKTTSFWESLPWLPSFWGKMLIKAVAPESKRKLKAPKIFQPSRSSVDSAVIGRFIDQQSRVIRYMKATEDLDLEKIKISSPVTNLITYSLMDAYRIIVTHEKRHILQARRVLDQSVVRSSP